MRPALWSTLVAVDLNSGEVLWERPIGSTPWVAVGEDAANWGYLTIGGPMVTEGGVVLLATTSDHTLRGYDGSNGSELWTRGLPASTHSTPMGFRHAGADYVVVTAGGELSRAEGRGDHVIAFRVAGPP